MKTAESFGVLFLGTRLTRLSDRLQSEIDSIFRDEGVGASSSTFSVLLLLEANGESSVSSLAEALGRTHSAVSQISGRLMKEGLIRSRPDPDDERRRLLKLSSTGRRTLESGRQLLRDIEWTLDHLFDEAGVDLLEAINAVEGQLEGVSFSGRMQQRIRMRQRSSVRIVPFEPSHAGAFRDLNIEWLEQFFYVEAIDDCVLSDPHTHILEPGGMIWMAELGGEVIGTVALIAEGEDTFELSKMAVTPKYQGLGAGRRLGESAITAFRDSGRSHLHLYSSSRLGPALALYESLGFEFRELPPESQYQRSDVYMVYKG